ncbi:MAG TPA: hypothetical protein ENK18_07640 [Deltaproteobacteria bacterium]|nr:hypothetical protein [Deltaproteobacteria bacterium]
MDDVTPRRAAWPEWIETWVWPYLSNSTLWPVWVALLGHVVVVITGLLLLAWREGTPEAWLLLLLLSLGSAVLGIQELRVSGRPGGVIASLVLTWLASMGLGWLSGATGIL